MKECPAATPQGRARKERERARHEEELIDALETEDEQVRKEKELGGKSARDAATASACTNVPGMREQTMGSLSGLRRSLPQRLHPTTLLLARQRVALSEHVTSQMMLLLSTSQLEFLDPPDSLA